MELYHNPSLIYQNGWIKFHVSFFKLLGVYLILSLQLIIKFTFANHEVLCYSTGSLLFNSSFCVPYLVYRVTTCIVLFCIDTMWMELCTLYELRENKDWIVWMSNLCIVIQSSSDYRIWKFKMLSIWLEHILLCYILWMICYECGVCMLIWFETSEFVHIL